MTSIGQCYACGRPGAIVRTMTLPFGTKKKRRQVCDACRRRITRGDLLEELKAGRGPLLEYFRGRT